MPQMGFKPTIPVLEWAKIVHATEIGLLRDQWQIITVELFVRGAGLHCSREITNRN
jgi:hypothetical protein